MKNAIKVICFVLSVLIIGTVVGYIYFTWDIGEYETVEGAKIGTAIITRYIGEEKDVVIPKSLRGKKVVAIDDNAFKGTAVTSVTIGNNITSIGINAFQNCKELTSVDMGESVENIGDGAFSNCSELINVKCSPALRELGTSVFGNDKKLTTIDLEGNEYLVFSDGIIYTADMTKLVESLDSADFTNYVLPSTIVEINDFAFYGQRELKSIKLNDGITVIPQGAFIDCKGLRELVIPDSVVTIESAVFSGSAITRIVIPASVEKIDKDAFFNIEDQITIVTSKGSAAERYAKRNNIKSEVVDSIN